jgi:hypothetical protein
MWLVRRPHHIKLPPNCAALLGPVALVLLQVSGTAHARPAINASPACLENSRAYAEAVSQASQRFGIPPAWLWSVLCVESGGLVHAVSSKGVIGLMQVMPATWSEMRARYHLGSDPFDPHDNVLAGTAYLRRLYDRFGALGAFAAYNAGPSRWQEYVEDGLILPSETRLYIARLERLLSTDGTKSVSRNPTASIHEPWQAAVLFPAQSRSEGDASSARECLSVQLPSDLADRDTTELSPRSKGLFVVLVDKKRQ